MGSVGREGPSRLHGDDGLTIIVVGVAALVALNLDLRRVKMSLSCAILYRKFLPDHFKKTV
jgi:hypothetical protein